MIFEGKLNTALNESSPLAAKPSKKLQSKFPHFMWHLIEKIYVLITIK